jgi:glycerol-1-phosphate dehydrogenase [NAD(P)+]
VQDFHYKDFISRFDGTGTLACACGNTHHLDTRTVIVSRGALEESAYLLAGRAGVPGRLWVLSDENTENAAGSRWKAAVGRKGITERILPGRPKVHPGEDLVDLLADEARKVSPGLLVSVGSGVISDLVKRMSLKLGVPNWCVATAPSVDAYSSGTSAINFNGFHGSMPARASEVIVCDLEVMEKAPREMHLGGLGDLLAKFLAFLDWNLARVVTGEHYCALVSDMALESARTALSAARRLGGEPAEAARTLTDAALSSGFAMQAIAGSRSAATAEHTMAHFWESAHSVHNPRWDLHGILTGVASRIMLQAYRALYDRARELVVDDQPRLAAFDSEPPWQDGVEEGLRPFLSKVNEEMAGRRHDRGELSLRLEAYRNGRTAINAFAREMLDELSAAVDLLGGIGFPFALEELGVGSEDALLPFRNIRLLRQRYSTFDLAYDLGLDDVIQAAGRRAIEAGV